MINRAGPLPRATFFLLPGPQRNLMSCHAMKHLAVLPPAECKALPVLDAQVGGACSFMRTSGNNMHCLAIHHICIRMHEGPVCLLTTLSCVTHARDSRWWCPLHCMCMPATAILLKSAGLHVNSHMNATVLSIEDYDHCCGIASVSGKPH